MGCCLDSVDFVSFSVDFLSSSSSAETSSIAEGVLLKLGSWDENLFSGGFVCSCLVDFLSCLGDSKDFVSFNKDFLFSRSFGDIPNKTEDCFPDVESWLADLSAFALIFPCPSFEPIWILATCFPSTSFSEFDETILLFGSCFADKSPFEETAVLLFWSPLFSLQPWTTALFRSAPFWLIYNAGQTTKSTCVPWSWYPLWLSLSKTSKSARRYNEGVWMQAYQQHSRHRSW